MADPNFTGLQGNSSDFLKVLLKLYEKVMKELHVASVAKVIDNNGDIYGCQLIPTFNNEPEKVVQAYCLENVEPSVDDWVLIVFTDRNFIKNLKQAKNNQNISAIESQSELHSQTYGIIIGKIKHDSTVNQ